MTGEPIRVEIVAPVHNRGEITLQCLRSLSRIENDRLDMHIVIVDDGSTDGTSDEIRQHFPEVELIQGDGNLFFTEGTNAGIRAALKHEPKYILLINDDAVFDSRFLACLVETAEANPRSVVGPLLLLWDQPHKVFQVSPVWDTWRGGWRHWQQQTVWTVPEKPWQVNLIVGNCLLIPVEAIQECGLMNSKHFPNFGDAEYTPRLKRKGWNLLIDPRSSVFCQPNREFQRLRSLPLTKMLRALLLDLKDARNLRWRFYSHWYTAPNRFAAFVAFSSFILRVPFNRSNENSAWTSSRKEPPLAELF